MDVHEVTATRQAPSPHMRIAFIAQPFERMDPPVRGGSLALWVYYMAQLCAQRGHEAVVFANHGELFSARHASHNDVEYIFTPTGVDRFLNKLYGQVWPPPLLTSTRRRALGLFAAPWFHWKYAVEVARRARDLNCDFVHIMNYSQFVPVIRKRHPRARIILHMQCEWLTQLDPKVVEPRLKEADVIIGCSEYITRLIAQAFPKHATRCVTVPNAATEVPLVSSAPQNGKVVLFVGRLSPEKGVHDLIRAFHHVLARFPDARLHLVGAAGAAPMEFLVGLSDDPNVASLREFYATPTQGGKDPYFELLQREAGHELGKRIVFEGRVNHDQIEQHYQRATLLVNPSLSESFGISLVEAMMRSIPVVATRVGGMTYTVDHGVSGLLVDPANPEALAEAIGDVLSDEIRARQMGDAGRRIAISRFSWQKAADQLLEHIQSRVS